VNTYFRISLYDYLSLSLGSLIVIISLAVNIPLCEFFGAGFLGLYE
jgi:hypothetical protein